MSDATRSPAMEDRGVSGLVALVEGVTIAWEALRANKVRSILTIVGVAVGVSVVVAIAGLITGFRNSVIDAVEAAGPSTFRLVRFDFTAVQLDEGPPPWWNNPEITPDEARRIAGLSSVDEALFAMDFSVDVSFEDRTLEGIQGMGMSSGWPAYQPGDFVAGRDFTPAEVDQNRSVVVLTSALAEELFGLRDPIGKRIRVENQFRGTQEPFTVIGILQPEDNIFASVAPNFAVFPWTAAIRRLRQSSQQAAVLVVPRDSVDVQRAQDDVTALLRGLRGLGPSEDNDFFLLGSDQILDTFNQLTGIFFLVILLLASAGLLVGGVGVIGIMLISVTERTREIGVRKAVGATRREILWQFLVEASFLTVLGAAVGMVIGFGISEAVAAWTPLPAAIPVWAVVAALSMAALTGMLFGLLPAVRASRLEPVAALRYE